MHVPGHNPFIEELLQDIQYQGLSAPAGSSPGGSFTYVDPDSIEGIAYDVPTYLYSGISPEIMQALGNVFSIPDSFTFPGASIGGGLEGEGTISDMGLQYLGMADEIDPTASPFGTDTLNYFTSTLPFTNIFDAESIAQTLSNYLGEAGDVKAAEVKALTPEMIEKTTSEYYSPYEESERQSLVEKLGTAMGRAQTGGFAGSGARQSGLSGAERLYRGGYGDILSDIMKMRGQATGDVLDTIYGYQELLDQG